MNTSNKDTLIIDEKNTSNPPSTQKKSVYLAPKLEIHSLQEHIQGATKGAGPENTSAMTGSS